MSCAGLGALLAIIPTLWAKLVAPRYQALWWLVVAAGAMLAAWLLLAETIDRLAVVTAWQFGLAADGGANTLGFGRRTSQSLACSCRAHGSSEIAPGDAGGARSS